MAEANKPLKTEIADRHGAEDDLSRRHNQIQDHFRENTADLDSAKERALQLAAIVESSDDAIIGCTLGGIVTIWNGGAERLFGYAADEIIGRLDSTSTRLEWPEELKALKKVRRGEHVPPFETVRRHKDGKDIHVSVSVSPIKGPAGLTMGASLICHDISERKRLEHQLRQSQKMEAIGQLAGGVAHDFNNLLTVITGCTELVANGLPSDHATQGLILEIHKAADRAALLTRQLLLFSRKAVVEPKVLDLNTIVSETEMMLGRLIGEDIRFSTVLQPSLWRVTADAGQIGQVIINLAVNARDAMPRGGHLTIETSNVELGESYAQSRADVKPGSYVMVAVSDTGIGMNEETQTRIFEPFFTTKGPGKGTGLGLATVYGIVKQCGGHVGVYSELGRGTTFKIYLPPATEPVLSGKSFRGVKKVPRGNETVLVVEDEDAVRRMTRLALQMHGYVVLEARNGAEALRICEGYQGPLDLLLTDVVMPDMGGRQVAERLTARNPTMKVLFVSGYTDDAVVRHGILEAEVAFLQKPFTPFTLANKVREVLGQV